MVSGAHLSKWVLTEILYKREYPIVWFYAKSLTRFLNGPRFNPKEQTMY